MCFREKNVKVGEKGWVKADEGYWTYCWSSTKTSLDFPRHATFSSLPINFVRRKKELFGLLKMSGRAKRRRKRNNANGVARFPEVPDTWPPHMAD